MGSCTRRHFLLSTCFLQMITIIERQVFDFLGYMWAPIFVNFFQILFVIFGFYGAYHFRIKYIITYLLWSFLWIGWNAFLICFYLDVGELDKDSDLLNLGTGSVSWFEVNGYGCKPTYPTNITSEDPFRPIRPERVDECLLDYTMVEVVHSGVQCALALFGILGAILISYIFLDEDDRFDFMNGDAKSPQHTVVHPMYVSYTSIPTSGSGTMLSNKHHNHSHNNHHTHHHHQQQQPNHLHLNQNHNTHTNQSNKNEQQQHSYKNNTNTNNNSNTFLIHSNSNTPNASKNNTLTSSRKLYSAKSNKISSSTTTITPTTTTSMGAIQQKQQQQQQKQQQQKQQHKYYDDSTAKADHQLYTNNSRQQVLPPTNPTAYQQQQHTNNNNNNNNSNSSLSYASLQRFGGLQSNEFHSSNSNSNMAAGSLRSGGVDVAGVALSNSNYSLANSINNNTSSNNNNNGSGRFARIHAKPKPPKSSSYSNFINGGGDGDGGGGSGSGQLRPDIKYRQLASEQPQQLSHSLSNFEECFEEDLDEDIVALQDFKGGGYVPFQKPTPGNLFVGGGGDNNNPSYASLNSNYSGNNNTPSHHIRISPNNNSISGNNTSALGHALTRDNSHLFLRNDNDLLLERSTSSPTPTATATPALSGRLPAFLNPASRALFQQNGLPFQPHLGSSPRPARPSNIPLPTVPHHHPQQHQQHLPHFQPQPPQFATPQSPLSPSAVTPPPPPAPRPHIFQPRSGHAPYPDLSPEVTEKYAMPTQYVPRSPVASRIARRQRQQQQQERSHLANTSANFCDQIRDAPPGYIDTGFNIVRAKSHDRLVAASSEAAPRGGAKDAAPHVNRRSGRAAGGGKARPQSYCNAGGEGVIRHGPLLTERGGVSDASGAGMAYVA